MDVNNHAAAEPTTLVLTDGALSYLREAKAARDVVHAILACPSLSGEATFGGDYGVQAVWQ